MNKPTRKQFNINTLNVDVNLNIRDTKNYDLDSLAQQIRDAGRIVKPLLIEGDYPTGPTVLQGNRRTLAGKMILADKECPPDLKDALEKTECIVYTGLTTLERESLILDHGGEKPLARSEIVKAVWRLMAEGLGEIAIGATLYQSLAHYTGNQKKLLTMPTEPEAKKKYLEKWFRGTLGQWIMRATQLGNYVKDQFLLTHKRDDGLLDVNPDTGEPEKVEVRVTRERLEALYDAKQADMKTEGGWNAETGGETFNQLLQLFKDQDTGSAPTPARKSRPTTNDLAAKQGVYDSSLAKKLLAYAAGGEEREFKGMKGDDERAHRWEKVEGILNATECSDPQMKAFIGLLLHGKPIDIRKAVKQGIQAVEGAAA